MNSVTTLNTTISKIILDLDRIGGLLALLHHEGAADDTREVVRLLHEVEFYQRGLKDVWTNTERFANGGVTLLELDAIASTYY